MDLVEQHNLWHCNKILILGGYFITYVLFIHTLISSWSVSLYSHYLYRHFQVPFLRKLRVQNYSSSSLMTTSDLPFKFGSLIPSILYYLVIYTQLHIALFYFILFICVGSFELLFITINHRDGDITHPCGVPLIDLRLTSSHLHFRDNDPAFQRFCYPVYNGDLHLR